MPGIKKLQPGIHAEKYVCETKMDSQGLLVLMQLKFL